MNWINKNIKLSEIKPYEANPRTITEKGLKDLRKSIENFGIADPIIINTDGTLIGGHARYLVLKEKGVENVSARVPDRKLTDKQVQELNIRLNKNIAGEWDFDGLANWFEEDELLEWGFEEWEFGFDIEEIETINEKTAFIINCENIQEKEDIKKRLGVNKDKISYKEYIKII